MIISNTKYIVLCLFLCGLDMLSLAQSKPLKTVERVIRMHQAGFVKPYELAQFINQHFTTEEEKAAAIYIWLAENIAYDVDGIFAEDRIPPKLDMKKGVCSDFAALFVQTAQVLGLEAHTVQGFTRQQGQVHLVPHSWVCAQIDGNWFFFDPTWAAGYLSDGQFNKKLDMGHFMVTPNDFIKNHFPYDPFWQVLETPFSPKEFEGSDFLPKRAINPVFSEQLKEWLAMDDLEQMKSECERIEMNGITNFLLFYVLREKKAMAKSYEQRLFAEKYAEAQYMYEDGVFLLNDFITYRNNFFEPYESDLALKKRIGEIITKLEAAEEGLGDPSEYPEGLNHQAANLKRGIGFALTNVKELKEFVKKYLERPTEKRKALFFE